MMLMRRVIDNTNCQGRIFMQRYELIVSTENISTKDNTRTLENKLNSMNHFYVEKYPL